MGCGVFIKLSHPLYFQVTHGTRVGNKNYECNFLLSSRREERRGKAWVQLEGVDVEEERGRELTKSDSPIPSIIITSRELHKKERTKERRREGGKSLGSYLLQFSPYLHFRPLYYSRMR
jgi:hypothetical protein